ncbi:MAG: hypothetical protein KKD44_22830 [Proteobacteria bacterium]|nr:hypothetical protein [Pseudomonadota bacterium]
MDVNAISITATTIYTRGGSLAKTNTNDRLNTQADPVLATREAVTSSFNVSLSNEGIDRSRAMFESAQVNDKREFELRLAQEENAKIRELNNEKRQFELEQATQKARFEAEQRIEQMTFQQQQNMA